MMAKDKPISLDEAIKVERAGSTGEGITREKKWWRGATRLDAVIADAEGKIPIDAIVADLARQIDDHLQMHPDEQRLKDAQRALTGRKTKYSPDDQVRLAVMRAVKQSKRKVSDWEAALYAAGGDEKIAKRIWEKFQRGVKR